MTQDSTSSCWDNCRDSYPDGKHPDSGRGKDNLLSLPACFTQLHGRIGTPMSMHMHEHKGTCWVQSAWGSRSICCSHKSHSDHIDEHPGRKGCIKFHKREGI